MSVDRLRPQRARGAATVGAALVLALAADTSRPAHAEAEHDPLEPINRTVFGFNELVDVMLLGPVSEAYGELPSTFRTAVRNVLDNLQAPAIFVNDLLQGETDRAGVTFARFFINSTIGMFGLLDLASDLGHPKHSEDFGQTLAVWGVGEGVFVMLPLLGPSSLRDAAGLAVDRLALDPWGDMLGTEAEAARIGSDAVDTRERLTPVIEDLRRNSLDRYATVRSAYRQRRAAEIRNGAPEAADSAYENIFKEDADAPPAPSR